VNFNRKLVSAAEKNHSLLCVGLDPDPCRMPPDIGVLDFNRAIIDATAGSVCAYKLNLAFYEALDGGLDALKGTLEHIPDDIPVIGDAKRGDIGNTAKAYATAIFDNLGFDAATVSPYLGFDSVEPFIEYQDRGVFILCRTSNASAADFQSLLCQTDDADNRPLFQMVAMKAAQWNKHGNIGLVVGATCPEELKIIRQAHPDMPLLIPGVGAQGGDLEASIRYGTDNAGGKAIINSSRGIIYASPGEDFAQAAGAAANSLKQEINRYRQ